MASKIYVGRGTEKVPFLENTTDIMIDTGIDYTINTNFELDFEYVSGTTKNLSISTIQSLGKVCIYNQQNWDGAATSSSTTTGTRGAYLKIYRLRIYDGDDLVMDLIPDPEGEEGTSARFYDLVSQEYVSYKYSDSAIYKEEYDFPAVEAKKMYIGVNGEARKVTKAYVGVNGEATLFYTDS